MNIELRAYLIGLSDEELFRLYTSVLSLSTDEVISEQLGGMDELMEEIEDERLTRSVIAAEVDA